MKFLLGVLYFLFSWILGFLYLISQTQWEQIKVFHGIGYKVILTVCICFNPVLSLSSKIAATQPVLGQVHVFLTMFSPLLYHCPLRKPSVVSAHEHHIFTTTTMGSGIVLVLVFLGVDKFSCSCRAFRMDPSMEHT